jgi:hypothetical protein
LLQELAACGETPSIAPELLDLLEAFHAEVRQPLS